MHIPDSHAEESLEHFEGSIILSPNSAFSREVFKTVRPQVPRSEWPDEAVTALFLPMGDGSGLVAEFEEFRGEAAKHATQLVLARGAELTLMSPAAPALMAMYAAKKWRDLCLFSLLPLLFFVLILGAMAPNLMAKGMGLIILDSIGIIATHIWLGKQRTKLENTRFLAKIPSPGLHIRSE